MRALFLAFALLVGMAVSTYLAAHLAAFLEADACLDAGGSYSYDTGFCDAPSVSRYVGQLARPGLHVFWALFYGVTALPGLLAAWLSWRVANRFRVRRV